jgi:PAS domain S-box-containing protein
VNRRRSTPSSAVLALIATAYFAAGKLGLMLAFVNESATAVWPPTGIALACFLVLGYRVWPGILAGAVAVNATTAGTLLTSLGIGAGNTLEGLVGAWLVNRFAGGRHAFDRPSGVFQFAVTAGLLATILSATIGTATLQAGGLMPRADAGRVWLTWWLGDAAGALTVCPLLVLWITRPLYAWRPRRALEVAALTLAVIAVGAFVFAGWSPPRLRNHPLEFLCVPVLMWAAFRFGQRAVATATFVLSWIATWGTLQGFGPFARIEQNESLLLLQAYAGVVAVMMLAVSATVRERRRAEDETRRLNRELEKRVVERTGQLRGANQEMEREMIERARAETELKESEARLMEAQEMAHIGSWEWDVAGDRVWWSAELYRIYGLDPGTFKASYAGFLERVHPDDREAANAIVSRALTDGHPFAYEHRVVRPDGAVRTLWARGRVIVSQDGKPMRMLGTAQDITEAKRAEEERAQLLREQLARREAEQANRLKDEFLATVSHELRTPLTAILGWAQLLNQGRLDAPGAAKAIETIHRNATMQSKLIGDLLELTSLDSGKVRLERGPVDLAAVVEAAVLAMRPAADARRVRLEVDLHDPPGPVDGDPHRLQQVVLNLLSNAVKFVPEGGRVALRLTRRDGRGEIAVEDDGPGIDPAFLPHVFDRFRQADASSQRQHGGLGLGLAIARRLVELHGGRMTAGNRGGGGAVFTVSLPLLGTEALPQPRSDGAPAGVDPDRLRGVHTLLVDDDPDSRDLVATVLAGAGADVAVAASVREAIERFTQRRPALVVSDIEMPGEDGYALLERIRARAGGRWIPVVALTAYAGEHHAARARAAGFQAHIAKPVDPDELVQTVAAVLDRSSAAAREHR